MRLLKYLKEEGETSGGTVTTDVAKYERRIGEPARRRKKKKRIFQKDEK